MLPPTRAATARAGAAPPGCARCGHAPWGRSDSAPSSRAGFTTVHCPGPRVRRHTSGGMAHAASITFCRRPLLSVPRRRHPPATPPDSLSSPRTLPRTTCLTSCPPKSCVAPHRSAPALHALRVGARRPARRGLPSRPRPFPPAATPPGVGPPRALRPPAHPPQPPFFMPERYQGQGRPAAQVQRHQVGTGRQGRGC